MLRPRPVRGEALRAIEPVHRPVEVGKGDRLRFGAEAAAAARLPFDDKFTGPEDVDAAPGAPDPFDGVFADRDAAARHVEAVPEEAVS